MRCYRCGAFVGAIVIAVAAGACAPVHVKSSAAGGVRFASYRTYVWAPQAQLSTGDPRLDNNEFFQDSLQEAVDKELTARGLEKIQPGPPDLVIHYHASVTQQVDPAGADQKYGYCEECRPTVFDAGTLTLDFIDARTDRLVWRGWAERAIGGSIDDQRLLEQQISDSVARILEKFPLGRL